MGLQDYEWNKYYDFRSMNVEKNFYVPVFKHSSELMRITGSYSSFFLKAHPRAYAEFVSKENAKIRLITGSDLDEKDIKAIRQGEQEPAEVLREKVDLENLEDEIDQKTLEVISWLISEGKMEVKVGFVYENGEIKSSKEAEFHKKEAIWRDEEENMIAIIGSPNLSYKAMKKSSESFDIQRSWIEYGGNDEKESIENKVDLFESYWEDSELNHRMFDVTEVFEDKLSDHKPDEAPLPKKIREKKFSDRFDYDALRSYQAKAVENWRDNGKSGILAMATGTGKTITSLVGIGDLATKDDLIVISVPTKDLIEQWEDEIEFVFDNPQVLKCYDETNWKVRITPFLASKTSNLRFLITTNASSETVVGKASKYSDRYDIYYIFDEVHHMGTENKREKVLSKIQKPAGLMGLSATPERTNQEETEALFSLFDGIVFEYSLGKAIDEGHLSEYYYHVKKVSLSEDEREEYLEYSNKIAQKVAMKDFDNFEEEMVHEDDLKNLLIQRANVLKECDDKFDKTIEILQDNPDLGRTIIFTGSRDHLDEVADGIYDETSYSYPLKFHGKTDNRDETLDQFEEGNHNLLIGIKCLDEGIDIPNCNNAIILSSSTTEREFAQRRGRVLRKSEKNEPAHIYDFFVLPYDLEDLERGLHTLNEKEAKILEKELERIDTFAENAVNGVDVNLSIRKLKGKVENMVED